MAYYAYSEIHHNGGVANPGDTVTQKGLDATDEEWNTWVEDKVVGEQPLPDDLRRTESLAEYNKRKMRELAEQVEAGDYSGLSAPAEQIGKTEAKEVSNEG